MTITRFEGWRRHGDTLFHSKAGTSTELTDSHVAGSGTRILADSCAVRGNPVSSASPATLPGPELRVAERGRTTPKVKGFVLCVIISPKPTPSLNHKLDGTSSNAILQPAMGVHQSRDAGAADIGSPVGVRAIRVSRALSQTRRPAQLMSVC
jgi:hypothetical protein